MKSCYKLTLALAACWTMALPSNAQTQAPRADTLGRFRTLVTGVDGPAASRVHVTADFKNTRIEDALREIAHQAGIALSYKAGLPQLGNLVTIRIDGISASDAIIRVLQGTQLEALMMPNTALMTVRVKAKTTSVSTCDIAGLVLTESAAALAAADIRLVGTTIRSSTDATGAFCFNKVPAGTYAVLVAQLGYKAVRVDAVTVPSQAALELTITTETMPIALADVVVSPGHFGVAHEAANKPQTLSRDQIETLPQLAEDIYRTVNRLPGVTSNEFSAKLTVRGSDDQSLLVLYDGLELFEPYHLKDFDGSLSIIDVASIGGVDLTTGGMSAEYGNRLTGLFDMRTTNAGLVRPHTTLGISLSNARVMSEGSFAHGNGLWLVAARRGYVDILLHLIGESENIKPRYYDLLGKVVYQINPKNRISFHSLRAGDTGHILDDDSVGTMSSSYGSTYAWATWDATLTDHLQVGTQFSAGALDWHRAAEEHGTGNNYDVFDKRDFDFYGVKQDWRFGTDRMLLKLGGEVKRATANYDYYHLIGTQHLVNKTVTETFDSVDVSLAPRGTSTGAYVAQRLRPVQPLTVEAGIRWDRQSYTNESQISPRINAALDLGTRTTVRAAWGRYSQPEQLYQIHVQDGETRLLPAERAEQIVFGVESKLFAGITARVDAYRRDESDLRPRFRNVQSGIEPVAETNGDRIRFDPDHARAHGIEMLLQHNGARSSWAVSYALARSFEITKGKEMDRPLDQRHTFYADYSIEPARNWRLSAAWIFHSGWPATAELFKADTIGSTPNSRTLYVSRTFGEPYADRLPSYHRLDIRATRSFNTSRGRITVFADIFNAYDRDNPQSFAYSVDYRAVSCSSAEQ